MTGIGEKDKTAFGEVPFVDILGGHHQLKTDNAQEL